MVLAWRIEFKKDIEISKSRWFHCRVPPNIQRVNYSYLFQPFQNTKIRLYSTYFEGSMSLIPNLTWTVSFMNIVTEVQKY